MHAIALTIEALRGIARWGTGDMMEAAFRGFMALPGIGQTSGSNWWETLGVAINASRDQVKEAYRILAVKHHPDRGGDVEKWHRLQAAFEQFERIVGAIFPNRPSFTTGGLPASTVASDF
jgi:DnaJ-domain-containing protein 1